ncbi:MAG: ABC transporter permease [Lachnospiraceae bacterium]|nr:ABC transporter permease [Lachnospiraceae bacterium]
MFNLLGSELYKWRKSKAFYVCLLSALVCILTIWLTFLLEDQVERGAIESGTMGFTVMEPTAEDAEVTGILDDLNIMQMIQTFAGGGFSTLFIAVFVCIWVVGEYTHGAVRNVVGKGCPRRGVFVAKYISSVVTALALNLAIITAVVLTGVAVVGTARLGETFWQDCLAYAGVQLMLGMAYAGVIAMFSEFARSMAAGIGIGILLAALSSTLASGADLLFRIAHIDFKVSDYWIVSVIEACPYEGIDMNFVGRAVCVTVVWMIVSLIAGTVHFCEADV